MEGDFMMTNQHLSWGHARPTAVSVRQFS